MAQLTAPRSTNAYNRVPGPNVLPNSFYLPIEANATLYQGGLALFVAGSGLVEAVTGQAGAVVGRVAAGNGGQSVFTNTAGNVNFAAFATIDEGCFMWDNPDPLTTLANWGAKVYVASDHSVSATAGSNAAAGVFVGVDSATGTQAMVITVDGAFGVHS